MSSSSSRADATAASSTFQTTSTQNHYESHSASSYESSFFYSPGAYTNHLANLVSERLGLGLSAVTNNEQRRRLLDIGGGTGNFTKLLLEITAASTPPLKEIEAIVVDPFLSSSITQEQDKDKDHNIKFVKETAESFLVEDKSWWKRGYHQVLLKEVVHHLNSSNRIDIFSGIRTGLSEPLLQDKNDVTGKDDILPSLLIITRPKHEIDYPLWAEARQVWAENQPSFEGLKSDLLDAGFSNVQRTLEPYPCQLPLERWLNMVRGRFWSTFSNFSDKELEAACSLLKRDEAHRVDDKGIIHFEDRLLLISAYK